MKRTCTHIGCNDRLGMAPKDGWRRRSYRTVAGCIATAVVVAAWVPIASGAPKIRERKVREVRTVDVKSRKPAEPKAARAVGDAPVIKCAESVHDFGETWMGPKLEHTFLIKNEGKSTLHITRVKPQCGCTIAGTYPRELAPGATGKFPFSINSKKLRGKYQKSVTITSDDPATPQLRLALSGVCNRYVDVIPSNAVFGKVSGSEQQTRVLKIRNNTPNPLEVSVAPAKTDDFIFELVEKKAGQEYELHISLVQPILPGQKRAYASLKTNVEQQKTIKVGASASVPERLDVQPRKFVMARKRDRAYKRPIRFTNYGTTPVKVLEATCSEPELKLTINERTEGRAYTITVDIPANYTPPAKEGVITLKTDDKDRPIIKIPLRGQTRSAKRPTPKRTRPAEALVGKPAPRFAATATNGKTVSTDSIKDRVTVLDFFAVNCGFCKKQIPRVEAIRKEYEGKGVRFVAVSQTMRGKRYTDDQIKEKINGLGFKGELVIDADNAIGPLFKATSYPTMVVIGKTGKVEAVNLGNIRDLETRLKGQLDALLAGKPIPTLVKAKPTARPARKRAGDLVGKRAPAYTFATLDGKTVNNADLAKHPATILNFVAPNCPHCKRQVPKLEAIRKEYEAKGVRFVNVAETMRKRFETEKVVEVFNKTGSKLELAHDPDNKVGKAFNASTYPTLVLLGKSGKVEAVNVGNAGNLETRLKGQLDAVLAGKPIPAKFVAAKPAAKPKRKKPAGLVGKPAPAYTFTTLDGKTVDNADLAKHPATILNFVAPNCGYCKKQIPRLEKMRAGFEAKGVRFVNVAQTMRKKFETDKVVEVFAKTGSKLELAHDPDNKIGKMFNATGFPTMVVLGKSGKVEAVNVGNIANLEEKLGGQLDALIAGKPIPKKFASSAPARRRRPAEDLVGKPAPKFDAIKTVAGKTVSNDDFSNHPATVLNFVAPNCGYCKRQVPNVESIREEYEKKGVRFVNIALTMRKKFETDKVIEVFKKIGSKLELAHDPDNKIGRLYKAVSFPTMIVVDKKGKITHVNIGAKRNLATLLKGQLDGLIKG